MLANGTILGVASIQRTILVTGGILIILFTVIEPDATSALSFFPRLLYWFLAISCGIVCILIACYFVRFFPCNKLPAFATITLIGLFGAILSTPLYTFMDNLFPHSIPDDGWLDHFETLGWWQAIVAEFLETLPTFLTSWYAVNLPLFFNTTLLNNGTPPEDPDNPDEIEQDERRKKVLEQLYDKLPKVIGNDIVAISSDLHYLNVHTTLGKSLKLGSLADYVDAFGETGLQVHRSHWVAKEHVSRVHIAGNTAYCIMSTGLRVPISRSRRKEVKDFFGQSTFTAMQGQQNRLTRVK